MSVDRLVKAHVKQVARDRGFVDAKDALHLLDLEDLVDDDGDVDEDAVKDAIEELLEKKPYLVTSSGASDEPTVSEAGRAEARRRFGVVDGDGEGSKNRQQRGRAAGSAEAVRRFGPRDGGDAA